MATKTNENPLKKEKKPTPSSSSSSTTRRPAAGATSPRPASATSPRPGGATSPKPASANVKAVAASTSKAASGSVRSSVPNYLKPTVSSKTTNDPSSASTTTVRYVRKSTLPRDDTATIATRRQSITAAHPSRRRSLDVPPSARSLKPLTSSDSERPASASTAREKTTIRSMSFTPRPNQSHSRPAAGNLDRSSRSFKPGTKSSAPTHTNNLKRATSLTTRKTKSPKDRLSLSSQNSISDIDVTQFLDIQGTTREEEDSNFIHIDTSDLESISKNEELVSYTLRTGIEKLKINVEEKEEVNPSTDDKTKVTSPKVSAAESEAKTLKVEKPDELLPEEEEECKKIDEDQENDDAKETQELVGGDGNAAELIVDEKKEEEEGGVEENVCEEQAEAEEEAEPKREAVVAGKKESPTAYNDVIEEAKNKLLAKNTSKVKALAGAFETVIDKEFASYSKSNYPHHS